MTKEHPSYISCEYKDNLLRLITGRVQFVLKSYSEAGTHKDNLFPFPGKDVNELRKDIHIIVDQVFNEPIQENSQ